MDIGLFDQSATSLDKGIRDRIPGIILNRMENIYTTAKIKGKKMEGWNGLERNETQAV